MTDTDTKGLIDGLRAAAKISYLEGWHQSLHEEAADALAQQAEEIDRLKSALQEWAKSEAQWAKDFREGRCKYD